MKKIVYIAVISAFLAIGIGGCSDHLNTRNLMQQNTDTFFRTPAEIHQALLGVYDALYVYSPGGLGLEFVVATMLADYTFAGGGPDDYRMHGVAAFQNPFEDSFVDLWRRTYVGVHRANTLIEALYRADLSAWFMSETEATAFINDVKGQAYFLRGFFMLRAARFFGGMPIIYSTGTARNVPRASFSETFAYIARDFNTAIDLLPRRNINTIPTSEVGHVTVWAAKAYLARTFLFYTGYMTNMENTPTTTLPLPDGSSITNAQVVAHLNDVIAYSGHELLSDPRNLWPYAHANVVAREHGGTIIPWIDNEGLEWAGQDGPNSPIGTGNRETMFAIRNTAGTWGNQGIRRRNGTALHWGLRANHGPTLTWGQGWGMAPVNTHFWDNWPEADIRRRGSILDLSASDEAVEAYDHNLNNGAHHTGLVIKKYIGLRLNGREMWGWLYSGIPTDFMLSNGQDYLHMRFADVLLMHSELTQTNTGMNQVRARAGMPPVAFSMNALMDERKFEFAFEASRWFDLIRSGDALNPARNYWGRPTPVITANAPAIHSVTFRTETRGLLPIPESEIRLADGAYTQNPGW